MWHALSSWGCTGSGVHTIEGAASTANSAICEYRPLLRRICGFKNESALPPSRVVRLLIDAGADISRPFGSIRTPGDVIYFFYSTPLAFASHYLRACCGTSCYRKSACAGWGLFAPWSLAVVQRCPVARLPFANNHVSWGRAERRVWCSPPVCDHSFSSPCLLIISFSPSLRLSVSPSASLLLFIFPLYHNQGPGPLPTLLRALFPSFLLSISLYLLLSFPPSLCLFFCISSSLHLSTLS